MEVGAANHCCNGHAAYSPGGKSDCDDDGQVVTDLSLSEFILCRRYYYVHINVRHIDMHDIQLVAELPTPLSKMLG